MKATKYIAGAVLAICFLCGCVDVFRAVHLGELTWFLTVLAMDTLFLLVAFIAWRGDMPWLLLASAAGGGCLFFFTNYSTYQVQQPALLIQTVAAGLGCIAGTGLAMRRRIPMGRVPWLCVSVMGMILILAFGTWSVKTQAARHRQGQPMQELWAVPEQYDAPDCSQPGSVEELTYTTHAYATDSRPVQKRALVYLPYGYDETRQYNILYLLHGTGDDENYWLQANSKNKDMLDRMIASGSIEPLIVVTPTFYVEDDCADSLDELTFSFREELRNDLMVAVEGRYSTFAASCDEEGFTASRDHRAFAGLSRGAVTAANSALCGSLDCFSWFGLFSAFRTTETFLRENLQSEAFQNLPIHYLYVTSGNFDFALLPQIQGYDMMLRTEPRLVTGVNTAFDVYPMRYHSQGNWHLALYNFLQRIF